MEHMTNKDEKTREYKVYYTETEEYYTIVSATNEEEAEEEFSKKYHDNDYDYTSRSHTGTFGPDIVEIKEFD